LDRRLIAGAAGIVALLIVLLFFMVSGKKAPETVKPWIEVQEYIKQAEKGIEEKDFLKAKEMYSKVIEEYPDTKFVETAQKELEELNIKILFSPLKTQNSTVYIVKAGDSLEKIAKKFNTTVGLLMRSNNLKSDLIHPGKRLKVTTAKFSLITDKSQNMLTLKADGEVLKVYTVATGIDNGTPVGKFKIINKLMDPVWYKTGAIVPSGSPENILGSRWMGLSEPGYGIHGTTKPESIGKHVTAGCVRMHNNDVEELYSIVPVGTEVTIVD